jgi:hypothetical protein
MMTDHLHTGQPSRLGRQPGFIPSCQEPQRRQSLSDLSWTTVQTPRQPSQFLFGWQHEDDERPSGRVH